MAKLMCSCGLEFLSRSELRTHTDANPTHEGAVQVSAAEIGLATEDQIQLALAGLKAAPHLLPMLESKDDPISKEVVKRHRAALAAKASVAPKPKSNPWGENPPDPREAAKLLPHEKPVPRVAPSTNPDSNLQAFLGALKQAKEMQENPDGPPRKPRVLNPMVGGVRRRNDLPPQPPKKGTTS